MVARQLAKLPVIPVPAGFRFQPVDAGEVAARLVELALGAPAGLVPDLAGPRVYRTGDLIRSYLQAQGKHRLIVPVRLPGRPPGRSGLARISLPTRRRVAGPGRTSWPIGSSPKRDRVSAAEPGGLGPVSDQGGNSDREAKGDRPLVQAEPADAGRESHDLRYRRAERPGHGEGEPERKNLVDPAPPPGQRRDTRDRGPQGQIACRAAECREPGRGQVTDGAAQGEGRGNGRPVELLAARCDDAAQGQRVLDRAPGHQDSREHGQVPDGRDQVREAEYGMQAVGGFRASDTDGGHREPVDPGVVTVETELQGQHEHHDQPDTSADEHHAVMAVEVIRPHHVRTGYRYLGEPEADAYLGDFARGRFDRVTRQAWHALAAHHGQSMP